MLARSILCAPALLAVGTIAASNGDECGVYLAESSTEHVLGTFAGRNYQRDDAIGSRDAIVQFADVRMTHADQMENEERMQLENFLGVCWSGDATGGMSEADEVISAVGGPCFSSTGHVGMINAIIHQPSTLLRTDSDLLSAGYDETTSPGRGAFTTYHNLTLLAVDKIPAGMEIFLDFGAEYNDYADTSKPNIDDYRKMDEAMEKMVAFFIKHAESIGDTAATEVYEFMKKDVLDLTAEKRAVAARSLLPDTYHGLQKIIDAGGSALHSHPEVVKSLDWLKNNAYCQDNLVPGVSKIEHAGRGAFVSRDIKKGQVVAPVPLVPINNGRIILEYGKIIGEFDEETGAYEEGAERVDLKNLLLNYVLEHPKSSVLFFPAGPLVPYVNHGKKANVKLTWSSKSWSNIEESQNTSPDLLSEVSSIDMMLELVATRNIKKGEEILLDYGDEWEKAWNDHVKNWKAVMKEITFSKSALSLNAIHHGAEKGIKPFPTSSEDPDDGVDDESVELMCHILYDEDKVERRRNQDGTRTKVYPWIPHAPDGEKRLKTDVAIRGVNRMGCTITERYGDETSGYKYLVSPHRVNAGPSVLVKNVPHDAIRYVDKAYMSPQHDRHVFRHTIRFPDEIFPTKWKDLDKGNKGKDEL
mmetsp:Transcript_31169/g.65183  ORF Transcript_31169/g.65183 Transcript_31169/m.65183 type:complete len:642 (-) Transcript_31169:136-2061(-)